MQKRFYMKDGDSGRRPRLIVLLFLAFLFLVVLLVGLYIIGANTRQTLKKHLSSIPSPTFLLTATPKLSPSALLGPGPTSSLLRNVLHVTILNGSGVAGAAGGISRYLSGLGYQVVSTGNADTYAYRNVTVLVKRNKSSYAQLLKKDLQDNGSSVSASLSDDISSDAEVIVGK